MAETQGELRGKTAHVLDRAPDHLIRHDNMADQTPFGRKINIHIPGVFSKLADVMQQRTGDQEVSVQLGIEFENRLA